MAGGVLETSGMTKEFRGFVAVKEVDLRVQEGTIHALIGPNGAGKTTCFNLLKAAADGLQLGPMLLGMRKPIHVLVPSVTARGIVNMTALAVHQANGLSAEAATATSR